MRILFDNGTPKQLRRQLFGHEIETAIYIVHSAGSVETVHVEEVNKHDY